MVREGLGNLEKEVNFMNSEVMTHVSAFYYPYQNVFKDSGGHVIMNMYKLVSPNRILLFKQEKKTIEFINYEYNVIVKLLYPKLTLY